MSVPLFFHSLLNGAQKNGRSKEERGKSKKEEGKSKEGRKEGRQEGRKEGRREGGLERERERAKKRELHNLNILNISNSICLFVFWKA